MDKGMTAAPKWKGVTVVPIVPTVARCLASVAHDHSGTQTRLSAIRGDRLAAKRCCGAVELRSLVARPDEYARADEHNLEAKDAKPSRQRGRHCGPSPFGLRGYFTLGGLR